MSLGRAAGPILATVCGVCTAYAALGPELQKQAAERQLEGYGATVQPTSSPSAPGEPLVEQPTVIPNEKSLGQEVKHVVQDTKADIVAAQPSAGWFGLGAWASAFGGANSPKEKQDKKP